MGLMKDFDIRIRNGGDDAAGAVNELMAELQRRLLELQASMPRWIAVTERLPEDGVAVLGWDRDGFHTLHVYCGKGKSGDVWFGCNVAGGWCEDARMIAAPDYWMPLPAPPTDQGELQKDPAPPAPAEGLYPLLAPEPPPPAATITLFINAVPPIRISVPPPPPPALVPPLPPPLKPPALTVPWPPTLT